ncbi:glutathione S-transferase family protein [Phenylobacterium sp.]|uniref:glutathione S-transferase family protein n=1 Tax=Phenylobacterium sp. TaxID=1871053 RepID=UPI0035642DF8
MATPGLAPKPAGGPMKLYYSHNLNPRVAVAVARHLQSPVEFIRASPRHPDNEDAFRPINPNTLVPVLAEDGRSLWETDAIACRLAAVAGSDFWPTDARMPELIMWLSWSAHHFTEAGSGFYFENIVCPQILRRAPNEAALKQADAAFRRFAPVLDDVLAGRAWLVGERMSYADFRVASVLPFAEEAKLPVAGYKNILKWHDRLNQLEAWRAPFAGLDDGAPARPEVAET